MLANCYQLVLQNRVKKDYNYIYKSLKVFQLKKKDIKILLVDDEPDILEIVGYNLSSEGYQVITAQNGVEAVLKAKKISRI